MAKYIYHGFDIMCNPCSCTSHACFWLEKVFLTLSIYWENLSLRSCVIWASMVCGEFKKWLESLW